jgi:hypothetical protein
MYGERIALVEDATLVRRPTQSIAEFEFDVEREFDSP